MFEYKLEVDDSISLNPDLINRIQEILSIFSIKEIKSPEDLSNFLLKLMIFCPIEIKDKKILKQEYAIDLIKSINESNIITNRYKKISEIRKFSDNMVTFANSADLTTVDYDSDVLEVKFNKRFSVPSCINAISNSIKLYIKMNLMDDVNKSLFHESTITLLEINNLKYKISLLIPVIQNFDKTISAAESIDLSEESIKESKLSELYDKRNSYFSKLMNDIGNLRSMLGVIDSSNPMYDTISDMENIFIPDDKFILNNEIMKKISKACFIYMKDPLNFEFTLMLKKFLPLNKIAKFRRLTISAEFISCISHLYNIFSIFDKSFIMQDFKATNYNKVFLLENAPLGITYTTSFILLFIESLLQSEFLIKETRLVLSDSISIISSIMSSMQKIQFMLKSLTYLFKEREKFVKKQNIGISSEVETIGKSEKLYSQIYQILQEINEIQSNYKKLIKKTNISSILNI